MVVWRDLRLFLVLSVILAVCDSKVLLNQAFQYDNICVFFADQSHIDLKEFSLIRNSNIWLLPALLCSADHGPSVIVPVL